MKQVIRYLRVRLRVGIASAFLLTMVPLTLALIGYIYVKNTRLALEVADEAMDRTAQEVIGEVGRIITQTSTVAQVVAASGGLNADRFKSVSTLAMFHDILDSNPLLYSLYVGFEDQGDFLQTIRVPSDHTVLIGPNRRAPPQGTTAIYRQIGGKSGARIDRYVYLSKDNVQLADERAPADYDPRSRPWYGQAKDRPDVSISSAYVFASSGEPGFTLSRRLIDGTGAVAGVIGADITLVTLSDFLRQRRLPKGGVAFVVDQDDFVAGYPEAQEMTRSEDGKIVLSKAGDFKANPTVAAAFRQWAASGERRFEFSDPGSGDIYLAAFVPLGSTGDVPWATGIIVPRSAFTGSINEVTLRLLIAGLAIILIAIALVMVLARRLTRPIQAVIQETENIRHFDLDSKFTIRSRFIEINQLTEAIRGMRNGLRSFSTFVPKEIVRELIASGDIADLGGQRRPITVLFSDIEKFTTLSENLPPEEVMRALSDYFDALSHPIHASNGVIDKFIGDAIMALWNAPALDSDHLTNACRGALACREVSRRQAILAETRGEKGFRTRFGLHTGEAIVGTVGSRDRMQYTALGAIVNLASRVEGLNKVYGTEIIMTAAVAAKLDPAEFTAIPLDIVQPVGVTRPVEIFALEYHDVSGDHAAWSRIIDSYRSARWEECLSLLETFRSDDAYPERLLHEYRCRCKMLLEREPTAWTPVVAFGEK